MALTENVLTFLLSLMYVNKRMMTVLPQTENNKDNSAPALQWIVLLLLVPLKCVNKSPHLTEWESIIPICHSIASYCCELQNQDFSVLTTTLQYHITQLGSMLWSRLTSLTGGCINYIIILSQGSPIWNYPQQKACISLCDRVRCCV